MEDKKEFHCFSCKRNLTYDEINLSCNYCLGLVRAVNPKIEVGDVVVYHPHAYGKKHFPCFGFIKDIGKMRYGNENWITIKWFGEFPPNNYYSEKGLLQHQHIKIYKEVSIEELNI